jgi:hypothetical protein
VVQILELDCVASLRDSSDEEAKRLYGLLILFCFKTFSDYMSNKQVYGELNETETKKLRQLSIVTLG